MKMSPELKARFKELGISNGCWTSPEGKSFDVCRGGEFFLHSICVTNIKSENKWKRLVQYKALRYHSGTHGGYLNTAWYKDVESFNEIWNMFLKGYKEYTILKKKEFLDKDFSNDS